MAELIDKGFDRIIKDIEGLRGVKAGLLENAGAYPDGTSVVDVDVWNEFGTSRVPARPFMRVAVDQGGKELDAFVDHMFGLLVDGRTSAEGMDNSVGNAMADTIKKTIAGFDTPPNAPSTVKMKGRNDPLVDTGHMRDSIDYKRL